MLTHPTHTLAHTAAPLLRYLQAEPVVRDHEGRMFSATDYVLTQPTCVPDQHSDNTVLSPASPVSLVLNLLLTPHNQRLQTPPRTPIDHPAVVVIVDSNKRGTNHRVIERGGATVQAVQEFLSYQMYLPTAYLPAEMIREPYFDDEEFDEVSYSEIVTAMVETGHSQDQAEARWDIQRRLQLAVYEVAADRLITPEEVAQLPYW